MRRLDNFVGGEFVAPKSKKYVELINPATGEPFAEMPVSDAADVDSALQIANAAFQSWKRTTPSQRSRALQQIADILEPTPKNSSPSKPRTAERSSRSR